MDTSFTVSYENCRYRGEGNSSLVVSLEKEAKVLRLVKLDTGNSQNATDKSKNTRRLLELQNEFTNNVMRPLLGSSFVPSAVVVPLSTDDMKTINKIIHGCRPAHRSTKSIGKDATQALLLLDGCLLSPHLSNQLTKGPVMSIEIKPKQGFMLNEDSLTRDHAVMAKVCRFCMMQYYKLGKEIIKKRSGYCPLDLFSGSLKRMKHALTELLATPQNNLRIYEDRKLIFCEENKVGLSTSLENFFQASSDERNRDKFCNVVAHALLSVFPQEISEENMKWHTVREHKQQFCMNSTYKKHEGTKGQLPADCILDRILHIQKLDSLDMTYVYQMFLKVKEQLSSDIGNVGAINFAMEFPNSQIPMNLGKLQQQNNETTYAYMTRKIWESLIAMTAKDFSLMLTVQQLQENAAENVPPEHLLHDSDSRSYVFSFAVIDLDAKSLTKVEKVFYDNKNILEAYCKVHETNAKSN